MSLVILLILTVMQFIIQLLLYSTSVFFLYVPIHWLVKLLSLLVGRSQANYDRITVLLLVIYNIVLTTFVAIYTSTGVYAGISNLFASGILGIVMWKQFKKGGKYYLEYIPKKSLWQKIKDKFNKLFRRKYENNNKHKYKRIK